jgi:TetR/AcrR family transcriptional regulator
MPKATFFNLPDEKRRRIEEIAIEEFAANEYNAVSISRLVSRAGIAKGSFYQYFEDKKDLLLHLLDLAAKEKMVFLKSQPPPDPQMGMFPYLRWLLEVGMQFQFSNPRLGRVGYRTLYSEMPFRDETFTRLRAQAETFYRELVENGIRQGDIDPRIDPQIAAYTINTLFSEAGTFFLLSSGYDPRHMPEPDYFYANRDRLREILEQLLTILEHGMKKRINA